jgi:transcriptional regulator with XRE-family HTH domain
MLHRFGVVFFMFWEKYLSLCNAIGKAPNVVATEIGVRSSGTVTGWKNGATPRESVLRKLADYFNVPMSDLLEDTKNPDPQKGAGMDNLTKEILSELEGMSNAELLLVKERVKKIKESRG